MKTVIINGSPRKKGNTSEMCDSFANGIKSKHPNAEIIRINLYDYTFKGCLSCFSCKLKGGKSYGRCIIQDELTPVLQTASEADCLVIASPIYLMDITGAMKSFLERLCFPFGSYEQGYRSLAPKKMHTVTIYTMNCSQELAPTYAMDNIDRFIGHIFTNPKRLCAYNSYQFQNYSKYVVEVFSEADKAMYRSGIHPMELDQAFRLGVDIGSKDSCA